jgi:hypothetical protein
MVKILDITTIEQAHKIYGRFWETFTGKDGGSISNVIDFHVRGMRF